MFETNYECITDTECKHWFLMCQENLCQHKTIFPMYLTEFVGLFTLSALVGMANVGGIGGGGMTVPLVSLCWGFSTKESIALSGCTTFLGAVLRFFISLNKKHPEKISTHIDYGIVIVMLPLVIVGSATGVMDNLTMPPNILSSILAGFLTVLTY